jgi:hypothetical protein
MYEGFEEKEYQKEEETSGKDWSKARRLSLLAMRSHARIVSLPFISVCVCFAIIVSPIFLTEIFFLLFAQ